MSEQEKRIQRRKQEDAAFNRMLIWIAVCVVLEVLTLLLRRIYLNFSATSTGIAVAGGLHSFFGVFRFLGIVLTLAGAVWLWNVAMRQGKRGKELLLPGICTGVVLWLTVFSILGHTRSDAGMALLCALPVVVAVLAAIFYLYQRDFFVCAVLGVVGIIALWVLGQLFTSHSAVVYLGFALVWVLMAVTAWAAWTLRKREGKAFGLRLLPVGTNYALLWATCAVVAAALLLGILIGAASAYYLLFAVVAWLFCLAVYYTVKLM